MRTRLRSTIKWGGAVLTVLLLVVWVGSAWWLAAFYLAPTVDLEVFGGQLHAASYAPWSIIPVDCDWYPAVRHSFPFSWWFDGWRGTGPGGHAMIGVAIPIWVLIALVATPTLWLWRRDRRRQPGLCSKCGYDLRGADHEVCPECGEKLMDWQTVAYNSAEDLFTSAMAGSGALAPLPDEKADHQE